MAHLYLIESDAKVGYRQGRAVITSLGDGSERSLPFAGIDGVSVFGMAQLSTRFVRECISADVPILYYSDDGHYFGSVSSCEHVNPLRHKRQMYLTDDAAFCLEWSRIVADAKIRNSLALLESVRGLCELTEEDARGLTHSLESLRYAESVDMVLGFEGNAAKSYFQCLSKAVIPEDLRFRGRSSRPPRDPFNSMLSFGYSILYRNLIGAIERHGLHPYFAFMHSLKGGHAALASDLVEDLRAPIVDRLVLDLVNSGEVGPRDFDPNSAGAIYMKRDAMRRLAGALAQEIVRGQPFFSAYGDPKSYGFQVMLEKKIQSVIAAIDGADASLYRPFVWTPPS